MKKKLFLVISLVLFMSVVSCRKNNIVEPTAPTPVPTAVQSPTPFVNCASCPLSACGTYAVYDFEDGSDSPDSRLLNTVSGHESLLLWAEGDVNDLVFADAGTLSGNPSVSVGGFKNSSGTGVVNLFGCPCLLHSDDVQIEFDVYFDRSELSEFYSWPYDVSTMMWAFNPNVKVGGVQDARFAVYIEPDSYTTLPNPPSVPEFEDRPFDLRLLFTDSVTARNIIIEDVIMASDPSSWYRVRITWSKSLDQTELKAWIIDYSSGSAVLTERGTGTHNDCLVIGDDPTNEIILRIGSSELASQRFEGYMDNIKFSNCIQ